MSLELGIPTHTLAATLPEREFVAYQRHAARRMLPTRRLEMQLAQLSMLLCKVNGNKDVTLRDFLFEPEDEPTVDDMYEFFDFKPRNK